MNIDTILNFSEFYIYFSSFPRIIWHMHFPITSPIVTLIYFKCLPFPFIFLLFSISKSIIAPQLFLFCRYNMYMTTTGFRCNSRTRCIIFIWRIRKWVRTFIYTFLSSTIILFTIYIINATYSIILCCFTSCVTNTLGIFSAFEAV